MASAFIKGCPSGKLHSDLAQFFFFSHHKMSLLMNLPGGVGSRGELCMWRRNLLRGRWFMSALDKCMRQSDGKCIGFDNPFEGNLVNAYFVSSHKRCWSTGTHFYKYFRTLRLESKLRKPCLHSWRYDYMNYMRFIYTTQ